MEKHTKLLELQLEKCVWLVKEERLRLGAEELSSRHREGLRRLLDEMRSNCREYTLLQGPGRGDKRRTAIRYSRLFQKAVDEYVSSTRLTAPTTEYIGLLEKLQENLIQVLKFQQRRPIAVQTAQEVPCRCFDAQKKKDEVLALVEEVADKAGLRKDKEVQTDDRPSGHDVGTEVHPDTRNQQVNATVSTRSIGLGDGILINEMMERNRVTFENTALRSPKATPAPNCNITQRQANESELFGSDALLSASSSLDNSPSLGDLLMQFRKVLRDQPVGTGGPPAPAAAATNSRYRTRSARRHFDAVQRSLDEASSCSAASDITGDVHTPHPVSKQRSTQAGLRKPC